MTPKCLSPVWTFPWIPDSECICTLDSSTWVSNGHFILTWQWQTLDFFSISPPPCLANIKKHHHPPGCSSQQTLEIFIPLFPPFSVLFVVVQLLSCVWLFETTWAAAHQALLSFTISRSLLEFVSAESVILSNHLILCHPLLLLPPLFPSLSVFTSESTFGIRWPKYWSFSLSISPSNDYLGLISFRVAWFDLLEVQGTLKSLLEHHNSKPSILQHSAFFPIFLIYQQIHLTKSSKSIPNPPLFTSSTTTFPF